MSGDGDDASTLGPEAFPWVVLFEAALAPLSLLLGWAWGVHPLATFAWDLRDALYGLLASLPMLAFLAVSRRWPIGPFRGIQDFLDRDLAPVLAHRPWHDFALIALTAGIGEELLFRGVIQAALATLLGRGVGLLAASIIFGALHPISLAYAVVAGCLGAYLGAVWLVTGNLLAVIVAHVLFDFVALFFLRARPATS